MEIVSFFSFFQKEEHLWQTIDYIITEREKKYAKGILSTSKKVEQK